MAARDIARHVSRRVSTRHAEGVRHVDKISLDMDFRLMLDF
jgi:hypothetical protein